MYHPIKKQLKTILFMAFSLLWQFEAESQCASWNAYPKGQRAAQTEHRKYRNLLDSNNIEAAYPIWEALFQTVKVASPNNKIHFTDGGRICLYFAKNETDSLKKWKWWNKALELYEQNVQCNGDDASTRAYQAYYMFDAGVDFRKVYETYLKSLKLDSPKNPTPPMVPESIAYLAVYFYTNKMEGFDRDSIVHLYKQLEKFCADKVAQNIDAENFSKSWKSVQSHFYPISSPGIFGCVYYEKIYRTAFENLKITTHRSLEFDSHLINVPDSLYQIASLLVKNCGNENDLYKEVWAYYKELKRGICIFPVTFSISDSSSPCDKYYYYSEMIELDSANREEYKAKQWELSPAIVQQEPGCLDKEIRAAFAYRYADHLYRQGNFEEARKYCRIASSLHPDWGKPYILVGLMYASSGSRCNTENINTYALIWVAIDEWEKAKSVDLAIEKEAKQLIERYSGFMPGLIELIQCGIKEGSSYIVGCWIQQGTTVKVKK